MNTYAERLLQGYGITRPEDIDLEAIAFDQGATTKYRPLNTCEARIVGYGNTAIITINSNSHPDRQRFSLGHELGHWVHDKGVVSLACARSEIGEHRSRAGPIESGANEFASQLLMPDYLFGPLSTGLPMTLDSVRVLAGRFRTSLTATAIKLVRTAHHPGMVVFYKGGRLAWNFAGPDVPRILRPAQELDSDSQAFELLHGGLPGKPLLQSADTWIDCESAEDYEVVEQSLLIGPGTTLSLLWWKDESQVRDAAESHR